MSTSGDLWERIGSLDDDEPTQVLTRLFSTYDAILDQEPENREAVRFFSHLENAINFCRQCNLNRR